MLSCHTDTHGNLPLSLAGVELSHLAVPWLQDNISKRHIWFRILQLVPREKGVPKRPLLTGGRKQQEFPKDVIATNERTNTDRQTLGGDEEEVIPTTSGELALTHALPPDKVLECIITAKKVRLIFSFYCYCCCCSKTVRCIYYSLCEK